MPAIVSQRIRELHDYLESYGEQRSWPDLAARVSAVGNAFANEYKVVTRERFLGKVARFFRAEILITDPKALPTPSMHPVINGFIIRVPIADRRRIRESELYQLAHELGHCLFYEQTVPGMPKRLASGNRLRAAANWLEEENLCDVFARSLLFPVEHIHGLIESPGNLKLFCQYCSETGNSADLLATRLMHDLQAWKREALYLIPFKLREGKYGGTRIYRGAEAKRVPTRTELLRALADMPPSQRLLEQALLSLTRGSKYQISIGTDEVKGFGFIGMLTSL